MRDPPIRGAVDVPTEFALPGVLQPIARITTVEIAIVIARKLGGGKIHFGQALPRNHVLIGLVGRQAAIRIHDYFRGHGSVSIPSAKTYRNWHRCRQLRREGLTISRIAVAMKLSTRRVEQLLQKFPASEVGAAKPKIAGQAEPRAAHDQLQGDLFR